MTRALRSSAPSAAVRPRRPRGAGAASALLALAAAATVAGCNGGPDTTDGDDPAAPPPAPPLAASVHHYAGSPLSGPLGTDPARHAPGEDAPPRVVRAEAFAIDAPPEALDAGATLAGRLVIRPRDDEPLLSPPTLTARARIAALDDPTATRAAIAADAAFRAVAFAELDGLLLPDATVAFEVVETRVGDDPDRPRALRVLLCAGPAGETDLAVAVDAPDADAASLTEASARPLPLEILLADAVPAAARGALVAIDSPFATSRGATIALVIELAAPPPPGDPRHAAHLARLEACLAELGRRAEHAERLAAEAAEAAGDTGALDLDAAARALGSTGQRRALFALARATRAPLAEQLALSAEDELVGDVAAAVGPPLTAAAQRPKKPPTPAIAWMLEQAAIETLAARLNRVEGASPQARALLIDYAGGVGLRAVSLRELARAAAAVEARGRTPDLDALLLAANRRLLRDAAPGVRARAFDWLAARRAAPDGFDPLADEATRRAALDAAAGGTP